MINGRFKTMEEYLAWHKEEFKHLRKPDRIPCKDGKGWTEVDVTRQELVDNTPKSSTHKKVKRK